MDFPNDLKYTKTHEWVKTEDGVATCGLTAFAAEQIGDVVQLELPEEGQTFKLDEPIAVVESSKASEEIFAPLSGTVVASNMDLEGEPEKVNESPYGDGWMFKMEMSDESEVSGLLDADAYAKHVAELKEG
ncbi:MAG: glycine cleavage system protein GcvH [Deltaproteobacteria bacterium]|nr:glycine cleavage system protein GcvH [Deltaproteobacteria bacterium]